MEQTDDIKLIKHSKNKGQLAAIISGLKETNGEYISIIDSDDTIVSEFAKTLVQHANAELYGLGENFDNDDSRKEKLDLAHRLLEKDKNTCLLIDEALSKGIDLFVLPEKPFCGSLNNDLIKDGALLVNKKEDIF